jgi:hypothetical protein
MHLLCENGTRTKPIGTPTRHSATPRLKASSSPFRLGERGLDLLCCRSGFDQTPGAVHFPGPRAPPLPLPDSLSPHPSGDSEIRVVPNPSTGRGRSTDDEQVSVGGAKRPQHLYPQSCTAREKLARFSEIFYGAAIPRHSSAGYRSTSRAQPARGVSPTVRRRGRHTRPMSGRRARSEGGATSLMCPSSFMSGVRRDFVPTAVCFSGCLFKSCVVKEVAPTRAGCLTSVRPPKSSSRRSGNKRTANLARRWGAGRD